MSNDNPFDYSNSSKEEKKFSSKKIVDIVQVFIMFLAVGVVVYLFFIIPTQVDGISMFPTLKNDEVLLANKLVQIVGGRNGIVKGYDYKRGDIIVFKKENQPDLVKRVIGLAGDTVKIEGGRVYVNGQLLDESEYLSPDVVTDPGTFILEGEEKVVPANSYFVIGDNRPNSKDSRSAEVGFVKRDEMKGRNFVRLFPPSEFTLLKSASYSNNPGLASE